MFIVYTPSGLLLGIAGVIVGGALGAVTRSPGVAALGTAAVWIGFGRWKTDRETGERRPAPSIYFIPLVFYGALLVPFAGILFYMQIFGLPGRERGASAERGDSDERAALFDQDERALDRRIIGGDQEISTAIHGLIMTFVKDGVEDDVCHVLTRVKEDRVLTLVKLTCLKELDDEETASLIELIAAVTARAVEDEDAGEGEGDEKDVYVGLKGRLVYGAVVLPGEDPDVAFSVPKEKLFPFYDEVEPVREDDPAHHVAGTDPDPAVPDDKTIDNQDAIPPDPVVTVEPESSDDAVAEPEAPSPEERTWKAASGGNTVVATFVELSDGAVRLRRSDSGKVVSLPLDKLCPADQSYVEEMTEATDTTDAPRSGAKTTVDRGFLAKALVRPGDPTFQERTWTMPGDQGKVAATFVKVVGGHVVLKRSDTGNQFTVRISELCAADRAYVDRTTEAIDAAGGPQSGPKTTVDRDFTRALTRPGAPIFKERTWTDPKDQSKVVATFERVVGGTVVCLRRSDTDKIFYRPVEQLSPEDRAYVEKVTETARPSDRLKPPPFEERTWTNPRDGSKVVATLRSRSGSMVLLERSDNSLPIHFYLNELSPEDRAYVEEITKNR